MAEHKRQQDNTIIWLLVFLGLTVFSVGYATDVQFSRILGLVNTIAWPAFALFAVMFFKKIFTYLFFSMDSYNFFGAKGRLRNVEEVIDERVQQLRRDDKLEKERQKEIKKLETQIEVESKTKEEVTSLAHQAIDMYKEQSEEIKKLRQERDSNRKDKSLLRDILRDMQQNQSEGKTLGEELEEIGKKE